MITSKQSKIYRMNGEFSVCSSGIFSAKSIIISLKITLNAFSVLTLQSTILEDFYIVKLYELHYSLTSMRN